MLVWGRDTLCSNPDGLFGHSTVDMMKRGMKVIVVDPRANWLARHTPRSTSRSAPAPTRRWPWP